MQIQSLIHTIEGLKKITVEVILLPGLPQIYFLGQADAQIKESSHRIKSAIKLSGFQFPTSQQILVNLRPHQIKKSSLGLELAVVYGVLAETRQIEVPLNVDELTVYGELGLNGEVFEPEDLKYHVEDNDRGVILTGSKPKNGGGGYRFSRLVAERISEIENADYFPTEGEILKIERPKEYLNYEFTEEEAELLKLTAAGEHSLFLAGPAGSGKSTLAKAVGVFLKAPVLDSKTDAIKRKNILSHQWRPTLMPHHSASPVSLIGGGDPPFAGEITKAHGGVLILDEYLEFHPYVQESLRGPLQEKKVRITRGRSGRELPCDALVVATTNLCPCGKWSPGRVVGCAYSLRRCRSVLEKLSGPVLDRFEILFYKESRGRATRQKGAEILSHLERVWAFQQAHPRGDLTPEESQWMQIYFSDSLWSERRKKACLRVARSFADLDLTPKLDSIHFEKAFEWTCSSFLKLQKGMG